MAAAREIKFLEPRYDRDGRVLYFLTTGADRRHPPKFIQPADIPEPEAGAGWFECERVRRGPWLGWRALRRVPSPYARGDRVTWGREPG